MPELTSLDHLVLTVADIDRTVAFYQHLGMTAEPFTVADGTRRMSRKFGRQKINLHPRQGPYAPHAKTPMPGTADLCFLSDTPVAEWAAHLKHNGLGIEEGPVHRTGATGPILSIYLRDPDGNLIEISNPAQPQSSG